MELSALLKQLPLYLEALRCSGRVERTIRKYEVDVSRFFSFSADREVNADTVRDYAGWLLTHYQATTCNSYLIPVNGFLSYAGLDSLRVPLCRIQRRYCLSHELSMNDYWKMLSYLEENGQTEAYLLMRILGCTGIRVGELPFVTRQAVERGWAEISMKRKVRQIFFTQEIRQRLLDYCETIEVESGTIFRSKDNMRPIHSSVVWRGLKACAKRAGVDETCVYPHNLRHMFARVYMEVHGNLAELADLLGHSSLETTRMYTRATGSEMIHHISSLPL